MPKEILFPEVEPRYVFERDCLEFRALADGEPVECLITAELLLQQFGARGFSEYDLREAFLKHKQEIQDLARSHIEMGWMSHDFRIILTTRATKLKVHYGEVLRSRAQEFKLAQDAMIVLAELIGPGGGEVAVDMEWEEKDDRSIIAVILADANGIAADRFDAKHLNSQSTLRVRMARLWGNFLQIRSRNLIQRSG